MTRIPADPPLAWNDIEALPVYAAIAMGLFFLWYAISDLTPVLQLTLLKVVGIVGCVALRHAWLALDEEPSAQA
ncbi:hypothetical protein NX02_26555 [Sphingomonas sanxanigenens DSM 19645 = NX02]|uniref:Uncharacterized protein n=1 Tax=Sphingomonas sanxanigenens DSM 19645 = NX02 TaxID=1123269 RepID=W0AKS6_9SPHN|nr:hypothetical protein NX02_26555 [Sphingomonas sanxanigenens DSM 19645 = NX02]